MVLLFKLRFAVDVINFKESFVGSVDSKKNLASDVVVFKVNLLFAKSNFKNLGLATYLEHLNGIIVFI